ncbi:MAG: hypothetical protein C4523_09235 [Myxococcales bacterium]|nr:MAG: hypothetical protein C4523_09235 [Myxococcales bacterium]
MKPTRAMLLTLLALAGLWAVWLSGCDGETEEIYTDGDASDGDQIDGDEADGDEADGDEADGDQSDGDETDGDETDGDDVHTEISGTVRVSEELATYNRQVKIYRRNPFENENAEPMQVLDIAGGAGTTDVAYKFDDVPTATYYLMLYIDIGNNEDDIDDVASVYPDRVVVVQENPVHMGIDLYAGRQNPDWGSVGGTMYVAEQFQDRQIVVVAAQQKPGGDVEFWPSSVDFTYPPPESREGEQARAFNLRNLPDGNYYVIAFINMGEDQAPPAQFSPYSPYEILFSDESKRNYAGETFYVGVADPNLGSVSGTITLSGRVPEGLLGVYLYAIEDKITPVSWVFVKKNDEETVYDYVVPNLKAQEQFWVAGFFQPSEFRLSVDFWPEPLTIDFDQPDTKDWTDIDFNIAITEFSGTLAVVTTEANWSLARIFLVNEEGAIGGGADLLLPAPDGGQRTADFVIYPAKGGEWTMTLAIDQNGDNLIDANDPWCPDPAGAVLIDGAQLYVDAPAPLVVSPDVEGACAPPEAGK